MLIKDNSDCNVLDCDILFYLYSIRCQFCKFLRDLWYTAIEKIDVIEMG